MLSLKDEGAMARILWTYRIAILATWVVSAAAIAILMIAL
jgi:hypothetical protein